MNGFWKKKLPTFLLAMVMLVGLVPAAGAAWVSMEKSVDAGDEISFSRSEFRNLFDEEESYDSFYYLEFTDLDDLDEYGYFTAYDYYDNPVDLNEDTLENAYFYYDEDDVPKNYDYALYGLTFVAHDDADSGTLSLDFVLYGEDDAEVEGVLEIEIDGGSSDVELTYYVDADDEITFDEEDFWDLFDEEEGDYDTFYRMEFTDATNLDDCGTLYGYDYIDEEYDGFDESDVTSYWFYYDSDDDDDYLIEDLTFEAYDDADGETVTLDFTLHGEDDEEVDGILYIEIGESDDDDAEIIYEVSADDEVTFDRDDFMDLFDDLKSDNSEEFVFLRFTDASRLDANGSLYSYDYDEDIVYFDEDDIADGYFYFYSSDVEDDGSSYTLDDLTFVADDDADGETVTLDFTLYGDDSSREYGTLLIEIGDASASGDIEYEAAPGEEVEFDPEAFNDYLQEEYSNYDLTYLIFTDSENLGTYNADMHYNYGRSSEERFTASDLENAYFYYDEDDIDEDEDDCYPLEDLSFVASDYFDTPVTLSFRAYASSSRYVDGTVVITPEDNAVSVVSMKGDILYQAAYNSTVQINHNDITRFFQEAYPSSVLQSVRLSGVPATGSLYYNYYSVADLGASKLKLTAANCTNQSFYFSPAAGQYALSALTYIPTGSNYCTTIPFTAYGSGGLSVSGTILISVTLKTVSEVYGATPKGTAVSFPASAIASAVASSTGTTISGIQLLELPEAAVGTIYVGSGTSRKASISERYGYSSGTLQMGQLRFVPASGYTGSVEIPYVAYNSSGSVIAAGKFCLGVVSGVKKFSDVTSSTWCYKYVTELSDASVISGYSDGSFRPNNTISYGAALKLIMLAAGYPEQAPTANGGTFSGYLAKARADGLITRSNVNLSGSITRLQIAQLAAAALKLDTSNLSNVKPFTDTDDNYVKALNAAGIVEGYFSGGTSTFKPNNTLTRGQVSAIVWRMRNYNK